MSTVDPDGILTAAQRRTARKHGVYAYLFANNIIIRCSDCGNAWQPRLRTGGMMVRTWFHCPGKRVGWWECPHCDR